MKIVNSKDGTSIAYDQIGQRAGSYPGGRCFELPVIPRLLKAGRVAGAGFHGDQLRPRGMRIMPFWPRIRAVANSLSYDVAVMGDFSLPHHQITSVQVPTLVIGGAKSQSVLRQAVQEVAELLPNGELLMLSGQSHNVSMKVLAPTLKTYFTH